MTASVYPRLEFPEILSNLAGHPHRPAVLADPDGLHPRLCHEGLLSLSQRSTRAGLSSGCLSERHGHTSELLDPCLNPQAITEEHLSVVVHLDPYYMNGPASPKELLIGKAGACEHLETSLLEVVQIDGVVDVTEGIQLVRASFDLGLRDAQGDALKSPWLLPLRTGGPEARPDP